MVMREGHTEGDLKRRYRLDMGTPVCCATFHLTSEEVLEVLKHLETFKGHFSSEKSVAILVRDQPNIRCDQTLPVHILYIYLFGQ